MKAAQINEYGSFDVIKIVDIDKPAPGEGQILVELRAASLNPFDYKLRKGYMKDTIPLQLPITIGADFAGVVIEGSDDYHLGDEVYGSAIILNGGSGALAEFATANTQNIALKPKNVSFQQAAAAVLAGVSALQAVNQLDLGLGKKVLIHGGAGGIGSAAIQYAKYLGAHVATTATAKSKDFVTGLGADEVIDYETQKFEEVLHDYDAVFDIVGGETQTRSFAVLKEGGIMVSMFGQPDEALAAEHKTTGIAQNTQVNTASLNQLKKLIEDGVIKPQIDREFPLDQTAEAFKHLETGSPQGKVVVQIKTS